MAPVKRPLLTTIVDKFFAWWFFSLPGEQCSYTVERLSIPVADDAELAADLYEPALPAGKKPVGTLLIRSPYGIGFPISLAGARVFAPRGYQVLIVACRGTGGSSGVFAPFSNEVKDGAAVVAWMRKQPWYTGSFATIGGSYLGFTQWALLIEPPVDMTAAVIETGFHDMGKYTWGTGALNPLALAWSLMMDPIRRGIKDAPLILPTDDKMKPIVDSAPLLDATNAAFGGDPPSYVHEILTNPDIGSPFWTSLNVSTALDRADLPVVLFTGWYDFVRPQVMEQYAKLSARGVTVAITVGPWDHIEAQQQTKREAFNWLEQHVAHRGKSNHSSVPVRVFVTGAQQWRDLATWPPPVEETHELFLGPAGVLTSAEKPSADAPDSVFTYNPEDPTPSVAAPLFTRMGGAKEDDSSLAARPDVLAFTTAPLDRDIETMGLPKVELHHTTSLPYADLLVRVCDVKKGKSRNVSERFLHFTGEKAEEQPLLLELSDCAHRFRKGNRIRIIVTGGSHPHYLRNFGTSELPATATAMKPVVHTIKHNAGAISKIRFPVANVAH